ncbi:precorrin-4 C(11)-methyltransferase [Thiovibrio frasassiensis]|uniref:Precorrin-4 C(11)-methyltransferase n=1 Tax=Thiovibrio frasassiensis TaxID=2984131 RepID=A0A9X4MHG6_9BACT|nr:precorrin-4 C(11)-methyltransferase [Thiovibrio frasassiensis]MDG4476712.1 precorrin-4 C(11)-methyltransferase [Thiovibrio frasassiensis]
MSPANERFPVFFVGAGPGDPELITVKGQRLLREADCIVYTGSLVPEALLVGVKAEVHNSAGLNLDEVMALVISAQQNGKRVVRLHTGDPSIYGAINEQIARLLAAKISFQVVPGVSSTVATAAALATELTLPEVSQTVIITRRAGRTPVPEQESLASLASHQATMLILLSIGMIKEVVADLLSGGYPQDTPVAVVEKVSWPEERVLRGTLATIAAQVTEAGITKTAIIAVGKVLASAPPPALSKLYDRHFSHGYRDAAQ